MVLRAGTRRAHKAGDWRDPPPGSVPAPIAAARPIGFNCAMSAATDLQHQFFDMLMASQYWPADRMVRYQRSQLAQLLRHAKANVPFYERRLDAVFRPSGDIDWDRWGEIPIVKRSDLLEHWEAMQADTLPAGHGPTRPSRSSGSTGLPVELTHNQLSAMSSRAALNRADRWHALDWSKSVCIWDEPAPGLAPYPVGHFAGPWGPPWDAEARLGRRISLSRETPPGQVLEFIERNKISYFVSRANSCHSLALEAERLGQQLRLEAFLCHGTAIRPEEREDCMRILGAKVIGLYSSNEGHKMAHPCPTGEHYHVNAELLFLEILDDAGNACRPGEMGMVVITPFYSTAQPLIRYEQGDLATPGEPCACGRSLPVVARIDGRLTNLFCFPDGRRIAPAVQAWRLTPLDASRWQLAQTGPWAIELRYEAEHEASPEAVAIVAAAVRDQTHSRAQILVRRNGIKMTGTKLIHYVNEVPTA